MKTDHDEIAALLEKTATLCDSIPPEDHNRRGVPTIKAVCEGIRTEMAFAALPELPNSSRRESANRLAVMLEQLRGLGMTAKFAQELGRINEKNRQVRSKGGTATAELMKKSAESTKDKVLKAAKQARAEGTHERHLARVTAGMVGVSVTTARNYLKAK